MSVASKASGALPALIILLLYKLFDTTQARRLRSCVLKMRGSEAFLHFNEAGKSNRVSLSQRRKLEPHHKAPQWQVESRGHVGKCIRSKEKAQDLRSQTWWIASKQAAYQGWPVSCCARESPQRKSHCWEAKDVCTCVHAFKNPLDGHLICVTLFQFQSFHLECYITKPNHFKSS